MKAGVAVAVILVVSIVISLTINRQRSLEFPDEVSIGVAGIGSASIAGYTALETFGTFHLPESIGRKRTPPIDKPEFLVMNFFGAWCGPCKLEHEWLMDLQRNGVNLLGIDYMDDADEARKFLQERGNPYFEVLSDEDGTAGAGFAVTSIPQTLVIDREGRVLLRHVGRLDKKSASELLTKLKIGASAFSVAPITSWSGPTFSSEPRAEAPPAKDLSMEAVTERLAKRLEVAGGTVDDWVLLARSYAETGDRVKSRSAFEKALQLEPNNTNTHRHFAQALLTWNNGETNEEIKKHLKAAGEVSPKADDSPKN